MKNKKIKLIALILIGFVSNAISAPIIENFDSFTGSGYSNHVYNGWNIIDGLSESATKSYLASGRAVRLDDDNGATLQSPSKLGGVGTVSFWYRTWDGSPAISKVYIEISDDSLTWVRVDSLSSLTNTTYTNYSKVVNSSSAKFVQVVSSGEERLILDEFSITDNSTGCSGFFIDSMATEICSFDSVEFRGSFYSTAGIYRDTVLSTCDTIFILNLMTTTFTTYDSYDTICSVDDSLLFNGSYLKMAGTYYDTITRTGDCDSVVKLNLFVNYCPIACTELFISEYIEGSSNNKALEFYNPTSSTIDLTQYKVVIFRASNDTIALTGNVTSGDVHVLSHPSAALAGITSNSDATGPIYFNGDDRIELLKGGVVIDRFGAVGVTGNFAQNSTYHRIGTVQNGNLTYNSSEWVVLPSNTDSLIGLHSSDCISTSTTNDTIFIASKEDSVITICTSTIARLDSLVFSTIYCGPIHGTVTIDTTTNCLTYVPDTNYVGCDTMCTVFLDTTTGLNDSILIVICSSSALDTIFLATNVNDSIVICPPVTSSLANITSVSLQCGPVNGTVTIDNFTNCLTYVPNNCFSGYDTLCIVSCDSTIGLCDTTIAFITIIPMSSGSDTTQDTICMGVSFTFGTQTLTMAGTYYDTLQNALGCDSINVLELSVLSAPRDTIQDTICEGLSVMFGTQTLTMSGTYSDTIQLVSGCDSITVMELLVNEIIRDTITDTICQGSSIPFGTQILTMSGSYSDTSQNTAGCDSITTLDLFVNLVPRDSIINTICSGDTLFLSSSFYTSAGIYSDTIQTTAGCDSITTIDLRINLITRTDNVSLCSGLSYTVGTNVYTSAGTYTNVFTSTSGCDSTVITNLSYYSQALGNMNYLFCKGDSVQVTGNWYFTDSIVRDTISGGSSLGCDSITIHSIVTKTVSPALNLGADVVSCITGSVTLFASNAYDTYSWSNGGTTNILSVSGAISGISSTDYILNVTQLSSGCSATDTINVTFVACVGLDENEADLTVNLYPNPATNFVTIDVFNKYNSENLKLEILNSIGQIVTEKTIKDKNENLVMDVSNFTKGLYFVRISSDQMNLTKKLLILK